MQQDPLGDREREIAVRKAQRCSMLSGVILLAALHSGTRGDRGSVPGSPRSTPHLVQEFIGPNYHFASAVALSKTTLAISDSTGVTAPSVVNIYRKERSGWQMTQQLGERADAFGFGTGVVLSGSNLIISAADSQVDAYTSHNGHWASMGQLRAPGITGADYFGSSPDWGGGLALSGNTLVVGAAGYGAGRAYVFQRGRHGWFLSTQFEAPDRSPKGNFGESVAIYGSTIVIGADRTAGRAGRAYVFERSHSKWEQTAELKASGPPGSEFFGSAVAVNGSTLAVGGALGAATKYEGRVYVFRKIGPVWKQVALLKGSDTGPDDDFGTTMVMSDKELVVGAFDHTGQGRVYLFAPFGARWTQVAELGPHDLSKDQFGEFGASLAQAGSLLLVGATGIQVGATGNISSASWNGRGYLYRVGSK